METEVFKKIFDELYNYSKENNECAPDSKLEFIGGEIFDFTTYDGAMDVYFAKKMLDVIKCILNNNTFEYQGQSEDNYVNYHMMVNMPFLDGKLEWGTSIRGAWFDEYGHHLKTHEPYMMSAQHEELIIDKKDIKLFMQALIEWSEY